MARGRLTVEDIEFGKALADRLGLRHNDTIREWSAESSGDTVWVTMQTIKAIPLDEFNELRRVASERAEGKS